MNKRKLFLIILIEIIGLALAFYVYKTFSQKDIADSKIQQIFKMRDLYNNPLKDLKTDFVIINFWASWCPPCVEETPSLIRFTKNHSQYFTLIALSQDSTKKEIQDFVKIFPALKSEDITIVHDDSQSMARLFHVDKLPETFIYSVKQNKYFQVSGGTNWDQPEVVKTLEQYFNSHF